MQGNPMVSVICLCYNHQEFVLEALQSVCAQTYPNLEIIIADDASTDQSARVISQFLSTRPNITFIQNPFNLGNCATFNKAFATSKGQFIIDFATDDVMHPERVAQQVAQFEQSSPDVGVVYGNAYIIDSHGVVLGLHSDRYPRQPEGDIYRYLVRKYFICPPTMMFRRQVLTDMGGYDTNLAFEDFDFWVRSSRNWKYAYSDAALTYRRELPNSLGKQFFAYRSNVHYSTYKVCIKIANLNKTASEHWALCGRCIFEAWVNLKAFNGLLSMRYIVLATSSVFRILQMGIR